MPYSQVILSRRQRRRRWLNARFSWVLKAGRWLRANVRDTLALIREFRGPLVVLLVTLVSGTLLYSRVHLAVTGQPIPMGSVPYILLSLMLFQQPEGVDLPTSLLLMVFWYAMPLVGLYILAQGVSESARLFFNRNARIDEWHEAVARTYQRHIILVGLGQVGERVIEELYTVGLGYNLIIVNSEITPEQRAWLHDMDVLGIVGDARTNETLKRANIEAAATLLVCTSDDRINFDIVMSARDLNGNLRIVSRVWQDEAATRLRKLFNVDVTYSTSSFATPAFAGAAVGIEIAQVFHIGGEDYSLIRFEISKDSPFVSRAVGDLQAQLDISIVMLKRASLPEFSPDAERVVEVGDSIIVFAEYQRLVDLIASNRSAADKNHVIVMGVGHVGERVTNLLMSMGYTLTVIDHDMHSHVRTRLKAYGCRAIIGEGDNADTLNKADIFGAASIVICTADDRLNFDVSTLARDMNPELQVVSRVHDTLLARQMKNYLNVQAAISPAELVAPAFIGAATGSFVAQSFAFSGREYSTVRLQVQKHHKQFVGKRIGDLEASFSKVALSIEVIIWERGGEVLVTPLDSTEVRLGDVLVIFGEHKTLVDILG
jgi:voltage-gated potassium channel